MAGPFIKRRNTFAYNQHDIFCPMRAFLYTAYTSFYLLAPRPFRPACPRLFAHSRDPLLALAAKAASPLPSDSLISSIASATATCIHARTM